MSGDAAIQSSTIGDANGGTISISARTFDLRSSGEVFSTVLGNGRGGVVNVNTDAITMNSESSISSNTEAGRGGSVSIQTRTLDMHGGASITAATVGAGDAGAVKIVASDAIHISGNLSGINSPSAPQPGATVGGKGGFIDVRAKSIDLIDSGTIRATTGTTGSGGDIRVSTQRLTITGNSDKENPTGILAR